MNFYIGNSIETLNKNDKNVELDDEMVEYLYSIKELIPYVAFFTIDPYSDLVVEEEDISDIIMMCKYVIKEQILNAYDESEELILVINELNDLCHNALKKGEKIIVIGD
ncbi:MAG: hypothetical protein GX383_10790 [Clostridium sp.]|nr:hypothetical protein [Clostridium sp.]